MRFKLDENLGTRTASLIQAQGHDVDTVRQEGLAGESDQRLFEVFCGEKRCLVTLDLDFADVTRFPPSRSNGIVAIRVPRNPSLDPLRLGGHLWIVEVNRIRVHDVETDDG